MTSCTLTVTSLDQLGWDLVIFNMFNFYFLVNFVHLGILVHFKPLNPITI